MKIEQFLLLVKDIVIWRELCLDRDPLYLLIDHIERIINHFKVGSLIEVPATDGDRIWVEQDFQEGLDFIRAQMGKRYDLTDSMFIGPFIRLIQRELIFDS